jgi:hypothetical protein
MNRTVLFLLGVILLAGCTAPFLGGGPQEEPVKVSLNNTASETNSFAVWVVKGGIEDKSIQVRYEDGGQDKASPEGELSTYRFPPRNVNVTSVELPNESSVLKGKYDLGPGQSTLLSIEEFSIGWTVVVVHYQDGNVISIVQATCEGESLVALRVVTNDGEPVGGVPTVSCV